jgi:hypothetical protein
MIEPRMLLRLGLRNRPSAVVTGSTHPFAEAESLSLRLHQLVILSTEWCRDSNDLNETTQC